MVDPWFYGVAIPAVVILGISKSGFGSGLGSIAVPLLAMVVSVPAAAAILMPVLLVLDLLSIHAFRKDFDKDLLKWMIPWSIFGVFIGYVSFKTLDSRWVSGIVGVCTLLFLAQRVFFPKAKLFSSPSKRTGILLTITSGFTSFLAHAGGPPINAYMLPLNLAPMRFAATLAVLFTFVNLSKWLPYSLLGLLDTQNMMASLTLLPFAPIGVWLGVRWAKKMKPDLFFKLVHLGMFLTGCKLIWDAFGA